MNPLSPTLGTNLPTGEAVNPYTPMSSPTMPTVPSGLGGNVNSAQNVLNQLQQNTAPKNPPQNSGGGFLGDITRLLPTIGSIALPTIADLATGGLAAPFDIGLAGIGGGLGQAGENLAQGKNPLQMNDLTSAGLGAAGQAGGELLGKGMQVGGKYLAKLGTDASAKAIADSADQAAVDAANATKNNFGGMGTGVQTANNLKDNQAIMTSFGRDATSPEQMAHVAQGGNFIDGIDQQALAQGASNPIKTSDVLTSNNIVNLTPQEQQAAVDAKIINERGQIPETLTPQQVNDFAQSLGAQEREAKALMENSRLNAPQHFNTLKSNYDNISALYKNAKDVAGTPEVNAAIASRTVTPEEKQALVDEFGQKQADSIEAQVNNAKTHTDLVNAKRPYAEMNNLSRNAIKDEQAVATPRGVARAKQGLNNLVDNPSKLLNPKTLAELAGGYETVTNHPTVGLPLMALGMLGGSPGALEGVGGILSRLGTTTGADTIGQAAMGAIPGAIGSMIGSSPTVSQNQPQGVNANMNGGLQNSLLEQLLRQDLSAGNEVLSGATAPGLSSEVSQLPNLLGYATKALAAEKAAQEMANTSSLAGTGQGPVMGLLSQLGQTFTGGPASLLNNTLAIQEQQATKALEAAGVTPTAMPTMTQNRPTAQQTIDGIRQLMSTLGGGQAPQYAQ